MAVEDRTHSFHAAAIEDLDAVYIEVWRFKGFNMKCPAPDS